MSKLLSNKKLGLLLAFIYFTSYVTRINLSAIVQEIISDTGYEKSSFSIILVFLSITYGLGQIINGFIGDKIKPQSVILCGLIIATIVNLIFPIFSKSILILTILWAINGFAQAMMWPPMVRIMVNTFDEEEYNKIIVKVINGAYIGTLFIYLISPLIIYILNWKFVFILSAIFGFFAIYLWFINYKNINIKEFNNKETKFLFPKKAIYPLIFIIIAIILQGMLRDGITTWTPTYLVEVFNFSDETSILFTISLAVLSIVATFIVGFIYRKYINNEVLLATIIFIIAVLLSIILYTLYDFNAIISIILIALIIGCVHGINLCLISFVPKRFKKYGNISTISGIINSFTYVGAAISTYIVAIFIENNGWNFTIGSWLIIAIGGLISLIIATKPWKNFYK